MNSDIREWAEPKMLILYIGSRTQAKVSNAIENPTGQMNDCQTTNGSYFTWGSDILHALNNASNYNSTDFAHVVGGSSSKYIGKYTCVATLAVGPS